MIHLRIAATALAVTGLAVLGGTASAHAETPDERFAAAVAAMGIETDPDTDLPAVGRNVCEMLSSGLPGNVNPVPVVRGVVNTLQTRGGITREQAAGLMHASVAIYCPQYARVTGR